MLSEVEESMEPMATMKSTMYRALVHISEAKTHSLTIQVMCDAWMSELSYARSSEALSKQLLSCGRTNGIIKSEQEPEVWKKTGTARQWTTRGSCIQIVSSNVLMKKAKIA